MGRLDRPDFLRPFEAQAESLAVHDGEKITKDLKLILTEPASVAPSPSAGR